jgi:hypothetical protein
LEFTSITISYTPTGVLCYLLYPANLLAWQISPEFIFSSFWFESSQQSRGKLVLPNEENYFVLGLVSTSGLFNNLADNGEVVKMIKYYRSMLA